MRMVEVWGVEAPRMRVRARAENWRGPGARWRSMGWRKTAWVRERWRWRPAARWRRAREKRAVLGSRVAARAGWWSESMRGER